jgi:hypothetical protein
MYLSLQDTVERIVNKAGTHREASDWDVDQQVAMTPAARMRAAKELRDRVYPKDSKDIREWHRQK